MSPLFKVDLRFSEMKFTANGKTGACLVTPQSFSGDFIALNTPEQDSIISDEIMCASVSD